jgi:hypothetical protein
MAGRVPCNQVRFGVALRQGALYAYTHRDMQVWGYQVGVALPALVLGVVPLYGGLILRQPVMMGYGLLMLLVSAGDLYFLWRTLLFPRNASFDACAADDEILSSFALVEQA